MKKTFIAAAILFGFSSAVMAEPVNVVSCKTVDMIDVESGQRYPDKRNVEVRFNDAPNGKFVVIRISGGVAMAGVGRLNKHKEGYYSFYRGNTSHGFYLSEEENYIAVFDGSSRTFEIDFNKKDYCIKENFPNLVKDILR